MTDPDPDPDPDPDAGAWARRDSGPRGLQRERTMLAWNRTMLALVVTNVLLVRVGGPPYARPLYLPALGILLVAAWLWLASDLRYRRELAPGRIVLPGRLALLAAMSVAVGVGGIVVLAAT